MHFGISDFGANWFLHSGAPAIRAFGLWPGPFVLGGSRAGGDVLRQHFGVFSMRTIPFLIAVRHLIYPLDAERAASLFPQDSLPSQTLLAHSFAAHDESVSLRFLALGVCLAIGVGVCLRVDGLDRKSFWIDESFTAVRVSASTSSGTIEALKRSPFPPLYYLMMRGWVAIVGLNDPALRLPSLGFGLLTLPATFLAWRRLIGRRASLWVLLLLALNAFHIWYSNDAKMYSLLWLLATLSSAAFLNLVLRGQFSIFWATVYALSTECLPLVSYVGVAPLLAQGVYGVGLFFLFPERRSAVLRVGLLCCTALIPFAIWGPVAFKAAVERYGIEWIPPATWSHASIDLFRLLGMYLLGYQTIDGPNPQGLWWVILSWIFGPCIFITGILLACSLVESVRQRRDHECLQQAPFPGPSEANPNRVRGAVVIYLAIWLLLPIVETLLFSLSVYSLWGIPRYFSAAAPALLIWLAVALGSQRVKVLSFAAVLLLVTGNLLVVAFDRTHVTRTPWRELARTVDESITTMSSPVVLPETSSSFGFDLKSDLLCVWEGEEHPAEVLSYALRQRNSKIQINRCSFEEAYASGGSFILINRYPVVENLGDSTVVHDPRSAPGYTRFRVRSDLIYESRLSAEPNPFKPFILDLWIYRPHSVSDRVKT